MMYYFAYGSNMDQEQMKIRCPGAIFLGKAILDGYRLAFTIFSPKRQCGCADIVPSYSEKVYGLLYQMTEDDMEAMDRFEGHPNYYQRIDVTIETERGLFLAHSYEVVNKVDGQKPSTHYLGLIAQAAILHDFPNEYRNMLATTVTSD